MDVTSRDTSRTKRSVPHAAVAEPDYAPGIMPDCFRTWTVLPHDPIEKLEDNLWRVQGMLGKIQRTMVVARMKNGDLVIHNGVALEEPAMKELEAFGRPRVLVVPNAFHRQDAFIWKERYPDMVVAAPSAARKKVSKIVPVDCTYEDAPSDDTVKLSGIEGFKATEGLLTVKSGGRTSVVFNDAVLNLSKRSFPEEAFLSPTGRPSVPRFARWLWVKDKHAMRGQLEKLAADAGLARVVFGHGATLEGEEARSALKKASESLS